MFGPFHVEGAKTAPHGTDISVGVKGDPCFVKAQVTGVDGKPITDATVDVRHADAEGLYDVQDPSWNREAMKLRPIFKTDTEGRFNFRTIKPCAYPIPTDGPVDEMLKATNRHAMRPAHIHFMVSAPGYDKLTHIFVEGDEWLDSDETPNPLPMGEGQGAPGEGDGRMHSGGLPAYGWRHQETDTWSNGEGLSIVKPAI